MLPVFSQIADCMKVLKRESENKRGKKEWYSDKWTYQLLCGMAVIPRRVKNHSFVLSSLLLLEWWYFLFFTKLVRNSTKERQQKCGGVISIRAKNEPVARRSQTQPPNATMMGNYVKRTKFAYLQLPLTLEQLCQSSRHLFLAINILVVVVAGYGKLLPRKIITSGQMIQKALSHNL